MVTMTATPGPRAVLRDPARFAETFLYILNKEQQLVRLRYNAAQRDYLANRTHRDLILKARQLGFSTAIQAELFRLAISRTAITATLSHEDDTTQKLRRMADRFYDNMPEGLRPVRRYANSSLTTYPETMSEVVIGTAGNVNKGRGGTYSHVHGSEVAFWKDAQAVTAGLMQGGSPAIVLESTPNGAQGYFYERCMEALDGSPDWALHFYPWWWDPAYAVELPPEEARELPSSYSDDERRLADAHALTPGQIAWRRMKQRELKHLFPQEYPEDPVTCFLLSGGGYFGDITAACTAPMAVEPDPDHRYVAGLDFGKSNDYTVLIVIDATARVQVDMLRVNKLPWRTMRRRIGDVCRYWDVELLVGEENSLGGPNVEALQDDGLPVVPFTTTNRSKTTIMDALHEALHLDELTLQPRPALMRELRAFTASQTRTGLWTLAAPDGEHDDTVMALALSWHAAAGPRLTLGIAEV